MFFSKLTNQKNSTTAISVLLLSLSLFLVIGHFAQAPAGGQDSWNHFLYARWGLKHPELLIDQWGKPLFTMLAAPLTKLGFNGVYALNYLAVLATAWLVYLTARRIGFKNPWLTLLLFCWQPVVLANTHSFLTEPTNALLLAIVLYLFASNKYVAAALVASFFPMARTEGYLLLAVVIMFLIMRGKWKILPFTLVGVILLATLGAFISGDWLWIYTSNPYFNAHNNPMATGGHDFFHFAGLQSNITGLVVSVLMLISLGLTLGYVVKRLKKKTPSQLLQLSLWLWWPMLIVFFLAHSYSWYSGNFGSHGLHRVFFIVSPVLALQAHHGLDTIFRLGVVWLNQATKVVVILGLFLLAFPGAGMPYPWQMQDPLANRPSIPSDPYAAHALELILFCRQSDSTLQNHLDECNYFSKPLVTFMDTLTNGGEGSCGGNRIDSQIVNDLKAVPNNGFNLLIHQIPEINARLGLDPWGANIQFHRPITNKPGEFAREIESWPAEDRTLLLWSIGQDPSSDWIPENSWVIWDSFYGVREGLVSLSRLQNDHRYKLIKSSSISTKSAGEHQVYLFKKIRK
ncbi:MAG: hypothetical protein ACK448_08030 [Bacteroidota bacterium]